MTTALLVLLVGDLLTPFQGDFRAALPQAFPEGVPEVGVGLTAPAGRTVAWVTVQAGGLEVEVVLHTARIPGDLRRVLRFTEQSAMSDRARAAAFTLAAMIREREADLKALQPPGALPPPPPSGAPSTPWRLEASVHGGLDVPHLNAGAGLGLRVHRAVASWLELGAGVEVGVFSAPATTLVQPAFLVEASVPLLRGRFSLSAFAGGGVAAPVLLRDELNLTTWLPLLRVGAEGRLRLGAHHGLRFALAGHFVSRTLAVQVGMAEVGSVGPAWVRPEIGYFGEL